MFNLLVQWSVAGIEAIGILVVLGGIAISTVSLLRQIRRGRRMEAYNVYRARLGQSLLLGLEFLVAAEVIRTVVIEHTLESIGALALIILVRTFLSLILEVEIDGRWPWQRGQSLASGSFRERDAGEE